MTADVRWPDGARSAVAVTVNFDGESVERTADPDAPQWGRFSYGRYGAQVGVHRLLDLFERSGVAATFFIPAWDAERHPDVAERVVAGGHEVAGHGYHHEDFSALDIEQQRDVLKRSEQGFERAFGQRPAGWRAPDGLMSAETRSLLAERGYEYESSFPDDDLPYVVATEGSDRLVELPVFAGASDHHYYRAHRLPAVVERAWQDEFDAVHRAGGLFNLTLHPRGDYGSGRAVRIGPIEALLKTVARRDDVWVATCREIAAHTLATAAGAPLPA
ncbi:MAG: polysaccharide deacetylase family protein [Dehalococcoidia bacterium]|jgi:peptidoglycan/xylan/chitin deacetylase (PgdA/CDA1 family)|nr:polysaccharide deacetylase family protein [Dehalococcoidia bacterium]